MAWRVSEVGEDADKAIVEVEGVVDSTNVEDFFGFINAVFKRGIKRIILDLRGTSYLSSGALSVIIDAYKRATEEGGGLVIVGASEMIAELFRVVQFDNIIEFHDDLDEAMKAL
ncbi:MAG: STAS domain-containing protein [Actinomycetota bacterium]|nr:STAS domain-containing protein [Actinomycetota bacterium]